MSSTRAPTDQARRDAPPATGETAMTTDERSTATPLSRRRLLQTGALAAGALAVPRPARAQAPRPGGMFVSAQTTEATGLDPQLVPAFSRSRRSPLFYNQLVRF